MNDYIKKADDKLNSLYDFIFGSKTASQIQEEISPQLVPSDGGSLFTVFISVCNTKEQALVFRNTANSLESAWKNCCFSVIRYVNTNSYDCIWIKAEYICSSSFKSIDNVIAESAPSRFFENQYFRNGISFDDKYQTAITEAELNGSGVISYKKKTLELSRVNKYISAHCGKTLLALPTEIIVFDCRSFFCDENGSIFELYGAGPNCGRRRLDFVDKQTAYDVIFSSSEYLSFQIGLEGKFDYGFYPIDYKPIQGYNILRHASSIWSLICAYRLTKDKFTLNQAEMAINYMIQNMTYKYVKPEGEYNTAFLVEKRSQEIKLGGNGVAVILLTEYMKHLNTDKYKKIAVELGNGILEMFNEENGEFYHVLNFPTGTPKEKYRTVYYDGEATFALARLYSLTKDEKWLNAAKKSANHFIEADYVKYRDHWVAYAMNEITMYAPEERYFEFALRNAQENLKRIYSREITFHTYLELLTVTFEIYKRIIDNGYKVKYLEKFDVSFFVKTIFHRAHFMLNGYIYPEYAMFLKYPDRIKGAFFIRHDNYRIRIDDIQHFCGAYFSFYNHYEELMELVQKLNIDISENMHGNIMPQNFGKVDHNYMNNFTVKEVIQLALEHDKDCQQALNSFSDILDKMVDRITDEQNILTENSIYYPKHNEKLTLDKSPCKPLLAISPYEFSGVPTLVVSDTNNSVGNIIKQKLINDNTKAVAITGSIGKTTTKQIIQSVLSQDGKTAANPGSKNGYRGLFMGAGDLTAKYDYFSCEFGLNNPKAGHFLKMSEIIRPQVCVITNIGTAHIENFKSKAQILQSKLNCTEYMSKEDGLLLINADDETCMARKYDHNVKTYALKNKKADYHCEEIKLNNDSVDFVAICPDRKLRVHLNVPGEHNIYGSLAAIAVADKFKISDDKILKGLAAFKTEGIRQNVYNAYKNNTVINDCYGASPEANIVAFNMLAGMKAEKNQRKIAVLGHIHRMGRLSDDVHRELGKKLAEYDFDLVVTYGGKSHIFSDEFIKAGKEAYHFYDEKEMIAFMKHAIRENDIILFKGVHKSYNFDKIVDKILDPNYNETISAYIGTDNHISKIHVTSPAMVLMDTTDKTLICGKNIHEPHNPASLITIASIITLLNREVNINDVVTVTEPAVERFSKGYTTYGIKTGEKYHVKDLMWLALKKKAADAMYALVLHYEKNMQIFMEKVNETLRFIGTSNTRAIGPYGKAASSYSSTAYDIALITAYALKNSKFCEIIESDSVVITELSSNCKTEVRYENKMNTQDENDEHQLYSPNIRIISEGKNKLANTCTVAAVKKDKKYYVSVLLGTIENEFTMLSYNETKCLLEHVLK